MDRLIELSFIHHATLLIPDLQKVILEMRFEVCIIVESLHLRTKFQDDWTEGIFDIIVARINYLVDFIHWNIELNLIDVFSSSF